MSLNLGAVVADAERGLGAKNRLLALLRALDADDRAELVAMLETSAEVLPGAQIARGLQALEDAGKLPARAPGVDAINSWRKKPEDWRKKHAAG